MADTPTPIDYNATANGIEQYKQDVNSGMVPNGEHVAPLVPTPPLPGQIPQALLPDAPPSMNVPVGASNASFQPAAPVPQQAPAVDESQYIQPTSEAQPNPAVTNPLSNTLAGIYDQQKAANNNISKAVADKAVAEDAAYDVQQKRLAVEEAKMQEMQNNFNTEFSKRTAFLDDVSKKLSSDEFVNAKVDGQHFWNSLGTGQKILGALSIGLGAAGASMNGGENPGMKIIQSAIDRDIEAQKFNIQNKRENLKNQASMGQNMLENLKAKFGSDMQAETAFRILAAEQTQNKLKQLTSRTDNVVVQQNAKVLNAKLDLEKMQQMQSLKSQMLLQQSLASGDPSKLDPVSMSMLSPELQKNLIADREVSVPGFLGRATTKENAQKFQEFAAGNKSAQTSLQDTINYAKKYNQASPQERAIMETKISMLIPGMKDALKLTRLTEYDIDLIKKITGDPNQVFSLKSNQIAKLQEILKKSRTQLADEAESYGFRERPTLNIPMRPYKGQ